MEKPYYEICRTCPLNLGGSNPMKYCVALGDRVGKCHGFKVVREHPPYRVTELEPFKEEVKKEV